MSNKKLDDIELIDKSLISLTRVVCLVFSLLIAVVCLLVYKRLLIIDGTTASAGLPTAVALVGFGLLQALWNPLSKAKLSLYALVFGLIGISLGVFVFGFSTIVFMGWAIFLMVIVIFLGWRHAVLGYLLMLASIVAWLTSNSEGLSEMDILSYILSSLTVGLIAIMAYGVWRSTGRNIRAARIAETRQSVERDQLLTLINSLNIAVLTTSSSGKIRLYNAALLNLLDTNASLAGKSLIDVLKLESSDGEPFKTTITNPKLPTERDDLSIRLEDGEIIKLLISSSPIRGVSHNQAEGYILVLRDITKTKSLEEERDEFISVISHELRTPIAIAEGTISNLSLLLEKGGTVKKLAPALQAAHEQIIYLADMINDLGTLSRAERGVGDELEEIELNDLLNNLYHRYSSEAQRKGLKLNLDIDAKLGRLLTSQLYLEEILQNFITNSLKYTPSGSITIRVHKRRGKVEFAVEDTGIGMSKSDQRSVFKKFYRSEDYRTRETSGTGLGLYVTKKLADKLHTTIDVTSRLNHGSTFSFNLEDRGKTIDD